MRLCINTIDQNRERVSLLTRDQLAISGACGRLLVGLSRSGRPAGRCGLDRRPPSVGDLGGSCGDRLGGVREAHRRRLEGTAAAGSPASASVNCNRRHWCCPGAGVARIVDIIRGSGCHWLRKIASALLAVAVACTIAEAFQSAAGAVEACSAAPAGRGSSVSSGLSSRRRNYLRWE